MTAAEIVEKQLTKMGDQKRTGASENLKWKFRKWATGGGGGARSERQREKGNWGKVQAPMGPRGGGGVLVRPRPG